MALCCNSLGRPDQTSGRVIGDSIGGGGWFIEVPLGSAVARATGGILAPGSGRRSITNSAGRIGELSLSAETIDELGHLTQAAEVEQMRSKNGSRRSRGVDRVVCRIDRNGTMAAIGQTDDDVGSLAVADANDRQLLSAERMMGMRDGHQSQREWGRRGSALGICRCQ